jgi:hypothetical protein
MNDTLIQQYIGFIKDICAQYECSDAAAPLVNGVGALCEMAFQHPTFEDPVQHKAYWKNVFFRFKTIKNVIKSLSNKLFRDDFDRPVHMWAYLNTRITEKRDKTGCVWHLFGINWRTPPIEITFTMPNSDNYDIHVTGKIGRNQTLDTTIPETELATTQWQFDGTDLKDAWNCNIQAYNEIRDMIFNADMDLFLKNK